MENEGEYYKQKIIEMINEMDNIDYLFKVYHYIIPKYKKEKTLRCRQKKILIFSINIPCLMIVIKKLY